MEVSSPKYGIGTVVSQDVNRINVQFESESKSFILDKKYAMLPHFEDDEAIIEAFTPYGRRNEKMNAIRKQLENLYK